MGAWGEGPFDNDSAADWAWCLKDSVDFKVIVDTLDCFSKKGYGYHDAIAAAESLARLLNSEADRCNAYSEDVAAWITRLQKINKKPTLNIIKKAIKTLNLILMDEVWLDGWCCSQTKRNSILDTKERLEKHVPRVNGTLGKLGGVIE